MNRAGPGESVWTPDRPTAGGALPATTTAPAAECSFPRGITRTGTRRSARADRAGLPRRPQRPRSHQTAAALQTRPHPLPAVRPLIPPIGKRLNPVPLRRRRSLLRPGPMCPRSRHRPFRHRAGSRTAGSRRWIMGCRMRRSGTRSSAGSISWFRCSRTASCRGSRSIRRCTDGDCTRW